MIMGFLGFRFTHFLSSSALYHPISASGSFLKKSRRQAFASCTCRALPPGVLNAAIMNAVGNDVIYGCDRGFLVNRWSPSVQSYGGSPDPVVDTMHVRHRLVMAQSESWILAANKPVFYVFISIDDGILQVSPSIVHWAPT